MDTDAAVAKAYAELGDEAVPGEFARSIRTSLGLSLKDVARRIGGDTHFTTIAKLETGKMNFTYEWCRAFGQALGVPAGIFFLPYEVKNTAKRVPIYIGAYDAMHRDKVAPEHYASILSSRSSLFGVALVGLPDIVSDIVMQEVIFDPNDLDLIDCGVYLVADQENPKGMIALYRNRGTARAFIKWPVLREFPKFPDDSSLVVFGRAIEVRRGLVSRNS